MKRFLSPLLFSAILFAAAPSASAQVIGTFDWQLAPLGSVMRLTVTQQGSIFLLAGFETQCGGNRSLPVTGVAVPQDNGQVMFGLTSINENGSGLHTVAFINTTTFSGTWKDNTSNYGDQQFVFGVAPGSQCPGGLRIGATSPDKQQ